MGRDKPRRLLDRLGRRKIRSLFIHYRGKEGGDSGRHDWGEKGENGNDVGWYTPEIERWEKRHDSTALKVGSLSYLRREGGGGKWDGVGTSNWWSDWI